MRDHPLTQCPRCGATDSIPVIYGYPDEAMMQQTEADNIALGGLSRRDDSPDRACRQCRHRWQSRS